MVHGDDKGLVLPPRVAPVQVVVIPIVKASLSPEALAELQAYAAAIQKALKAAKVGRVVFLLWGEWVYAFVVWSID